MSDTDSADLPIAVDPAAKGPDSSPWEVPQRVYISPLGHGKFQSIPQPDGTDIMLYTGGVYVYQRRPKQDVLFELRAQNAVVFSRSQYSRVEKSS